jgi:outer membrane protein insertion porin family
MPSRLSTWWRGAKQAGARALCAAMLSAVALCCAGATSAGAAAVAPEPNADPTIVVQGNRRIDADAIRAYFHGMHAAPGAGFTPAALDAALKELYATGLFDDVRIVPAGGRVVVTVIEAPVIVRVRFEGNKQIKDKDIAKETALKPGGAMTKTAVQNEVSRIVAIYHQIGRYDVQVAPATIARGDGRLDLVFEITEGAKTGVNRIAFAGNRSFSESRLKGVIKTTESGWFGFLKSSDVYDPDRIEIDGDLLHRFYIKNGFADAHISSTGAYDPAQKGFVVTFTVDEGPRYRFGTIDVASHIATLDAAAVRSRPASAAFRSSTCARMPIATPRRGSSISCSRSTTGRTPMWSASTFTATS